MLYILHFTIIIIHINKNIRLGLSQCISVNLMAITILIGNSSHTKFILLIIIFFLPDIHSLKKTPIAIKANKPKYIMLDFPNNSIEINPNIKKAYIISI